MSVYVGIDVHRKRSQVARGETRSITDTVGAGCEAGPPFLLSPVSLASG